MSPESKLMRSNVSLINDIEDIREKRLSGGTDKLSYSKITSLITRHKNWERIKTDIITYGGDE